MPPPKRDSCTAVPSEQSASVTINQATDSCCTDQLPSVIVSNSEAQVYSDPNHEAPIPPIPTRITDTVKPETELKSKRISAKDDDEDAFKKTHRVVETKLMDEGEQNPMHIPGTDTANVSKESMAVYQLGVGGNQDFRSSKNSMSSSAASIGLSKFPHAQEVCETFGSKTKKIGMVAFVLVLNTLLVVVGHLMTNGLLIYISPSLITFAGGVVIELLLLLTNVLTIEAMDISASIVIAALLTQKKGYSMAACGFMQSSPIHRVQYTSQLSLNSPCRKLLQRVSYLWVLGEALKLLSPLGATGVVSSTVRTHADAVNCIVFQPSLVWMRDRLYPTIKSTAGVAEYIFGNALGCMRSEHDCTPDGSEFIFGPQLDGSVGSGDTIVGKGFSMMVASECECVDLADRSAVERGILSEADQLNFKNAYSNTSAAFMMRFGTTTYTNESLTTVMAIGNMHICGGIRESVVPTCTTVIHGLHDAMVQASFLTDGTPASIALVDSVIESYSPITTITIPAVKQSLDYIWPTSTVFPLVSNVAGMLNAMLYWTSSDLVAVDPTLLSAGIETLHSMILRAGFQRSFDSKGSSCTRIVSRTDQTVVYLTSWGSACIYAAGTVQIFLSLISLIVASYWYFSDVPLGPAIRVITQPTYFMSVFCESPFSVMLVGTGNAQVHVLWQAVDVVVRIGESLETMDEPIGRIKMERPKLVQAMTNGRMYA
ncbi:hypothetical protein HDU78_002566 [Chytriomyces hyalinus]|nr:hypothetical protein HDU78_002566 [Chytriomyces hyalinus]